MVGRWRCPPPQKVAWTEPRWGPWGPWGLIRWLGLPGWRWSRAGLGRRSPGRAGWTEFEARDCPCGTQPDVVHRVYGRAGARKRPKDWWKPPCTGSWPKCRPGGWQMKTLKFLPLPCSPPANPSPSYRGRPKVNHPPPRRRRAWCPSTPSPTPPGGTRSLVPRRAIPATGVNVPRGPIPISSIV